MNLSEDKNYEAFKNRASNSPLLHQEVLLRDLKVINQNVIEWKGKPIRMTENAFTTLVDFLGLTRRVIKNVEKVLGEEDRKILIEAMKRGLSSTNGKNIVVLVINKTTQEIEYFQKSAKEFLPNGAYFNLFEDVMNNHKNMKISNMSINSGCIEINVVNHDWEFNIGGLKDEFFKSGLSFVYTPSNIIVSPFNERLICTNGMVSREKGLSLVLKRNDATSISEFFERVRNIKDNAYFVKEFKYRVNRMINTMASIAEMEFAHNAIAYHLNMEDKNNVAVLERFLPLMFVKSEYLKKVRIDVNTLDSKQKSKAATNMNVWEVVNGMTDIASHEKRYYLTFDRGDYSAQQIQKDAGVLCFKQNYDLENNIPNPFKDSE